MSKKGFTLIELLAVIVILAIIALIATPIIIGIINDAKKQSNQRSAELYLKAAELAIARENMNGEVNITSCSVITNETKSNFEGSGEGDLNCGGKLVKVDMDGEKPSGGNLTFSNGKVTALTNFKVGNTPYIIKNGSIAVDDNSSPNEQTESFTGTIYRNSFDTVKVGGSIEVQTKSVYCGITSEDETSCDYGISWDSNSECVSGMAGFGMENATCEEGTTTTGLTSYETEETKSNITQNFYLKHEVEDNIVTASYVCIRYGTNEEACVRGGNPSYYGNFDGMTEGMDSVSEVTNPTGNIAEMAKTRSYFLSNENGSCHFNASGSHCDDSSLSFHAYADGTVGAYGDSVSCGVAPDGSAYCRLGS